MPLLEGTPFPGECARTWEILKERTISLLEALERLHAAGFVHGDLKPNNVLVDKFGTPAVLELGVAGRWRRPSRTGPEFVAATLLYAAPEHLFGERATPQSDLYSVGVMLYAALGGELPAASAVREGRRASSLALLPLEKAVPGVSSEACAVVDALLGRSGASPESATDALSLLDCGSLEARVRKHLGTLLSERAVEELAQSLKMRKSVELVGPRQSGKSLLLQELAESLESDGEDVLLLSGDLEQSALSRLCLPEEIASLRTWENLRELTLGRLKARYEAGAILLVDEVVGLRDPVLRKGVESLIERGGVGTTHTSDTASPSAPLLPLSRFGITHERWVDRDRRVRLRPAAAPPHLPPRSFPRSRRRRAPG